MTAVFRVVLAALLCVVALVIPPAAVAADTTRAPNFSAEAVLLVDPDGRVIYAKNADNERAPASLVKLMTLYLACEDLDAGRADVDETVTVSRHAATVGRYRMGLRTGEEVPLHVLLEGVAIASANDAASALAERLGGGDEAVPAEQRARPRHAHRATDPGLPDVAAAARRPDIRLPRPRLRAPHPALQRSGRRAGAQDGLHAGGRLQPRRVRLARRPAIPHGRARRAHARAVLPRRQEAPALRLRRDGPRAGGREAGARSQVHPRPSRHRDPASPIAIRGYVFDAYGTLFDVHSVVEAGRTLTADPFALSVLWRQKQLEYTWLRSLMGRYEDFWAVTEAALRHSLTRLSIAASDADVARLMDAYHRLACFPEVPEALARLAGRPRAILSNGAGWWPTPTWPRATCRSIRSAAASSVWPPASRSTSGRSEAPEPVEVSRGATAWPGRP